MPSLKMTGSIIRAATGSPFACDMTAIAPEQRGAHLPTIEKLFRIRAPFQRPDAATARTRHSIVIVVAATLVFVSYDPSRLLVTSACHEGFSLQSGLRSRVKQKLKLRHKNVHEELYVVSRTCCFKRSTALFTSPRQHIPDGLRLSHAHKPSLIKWLTLPGIVVPPLCAISSRI